MRFLSSIRLKLLDNLRVKSIFHFEEGAPYFVSFEMLVVQPSDVVFHFRARGAPVGGRIIPWLLKAFFT